MASHGWHMTQRSEVSPRLCKCSQGVVIEYEEEWERYWSATDRIQYDMKLNALIKNALANKQKGRGVFGPAVAQCWTAFPSAGVMSRNARFREPGIGLAIGSVRLERNCTQTFLPLVEAN